MLWMFFIAVAAALVIKLGALSVWVSSSLVEKLYTARPTSTLASRLKRIQVMQTGACRVPA